MTLLRLGLLAGFGALLFVAGERVAADALLAATGATDFLDGYVARHFNQVSTLGKVIDPAADRIVLATAIVSIAVYGAVPSWLAVFVLVRESLVSAAVLFLAAIRAPRIDVSWLGKAGTFGMFVCFPLFLLGDGPGSAAHAVRVLAWVLTVPSLALSVTATAAYLPAVGRSLAEMRRSTGRFRGNEEQGVMNGRR